MAFEYIVNGRVVKLPVNSKKVAVRFRESLPKPQRRSVIDEKPQVGSFDNRLEVPNETITIVDVAPPTETPFTIGVASAVEALNSDAGVEQAFPVFDLGPRRQAVATDRVIVGFKPEVGAKVDEIIQHVGGAILEKKDGNEYVIKIDPAQDPFDAANELTKRAEVAFAEPDFVTLGKHIPKRPSLSSPEDGTGNGGPSNASANASSSGTITAGGSAGVAVGVGATAPGNDPLLAEQ
ncbi:MAG TPA: hypothetical protein VJV05_13930, partial [Pyrinomonadaceae bacterium]|nr:hypothetical protein [Pyrinomonadaceae bacterium]